MSNALYLIQGFLSAASSAATTSAPVKEPVDVLRPLTGPIAMGIIVLIAWIIRRSANPQKFLLRNTPGRPNTINPGHIVLLLALYLGATGWLHEVVSRFLPADSDESRILSWLGGQIVWFAGCLVVGAMCFRFGLRRGMGWSLRHWMYDTARAVLGYLAAMPIVMMLAIIAVLTFPPSWQKEHEVLAALNHLSPAWKCLAALSAVVMAPLAEEAFFRGLLQSMLRRYVGSPWLAVILTSAAFSAMHYQTPQNIPALFALGLVLGYNYERCGRLYASVLIHAIFNAVFLAIQIWQG